jgi:hypothetical protein
MRFRVLFLWECPVSKVLTQVVLAAERPNAYSSCAGKSSLAPEDRNVSRSEAKYFAPLELRILLGILVP